MYQLRDRTIEHTDILLKKDVMNYLGPNLVLQNCAIKICTDERGLTITDTKLIDCQIEIEDPLTNFRWCDAFLKGCVFSGKLEGCDFGHWPDYFHSVGGIEDCDFTDSILDGCRFIGSDASSLKLPKWPHYTVFAPQKHVEVLQSAKWPTESRRWFNLYLACPPQTSAIVQYAPSVLSRLGGTEKQLKFVLSKIDGMQY